MAKQKRAGQRGPGGRVKPETQGDEYIKLKELIPLPYQSLNSQGGILAVNRAWLDLLRYSRREVNGRKFEAFLTPRTRIEFRKQFPRFLKKGDVRGVELELSKKSGRTVAVQFDGIITYDQKRKPLRTHCIITDISIRSQKEKTAEVEISTLKRFFEKIPLLAYQVSLDGRILDCNSLFLKTLGYKSKKELIGKSPLTKIYAPSSRKKAAALFRKWKKQGRLVNEELQVVTKQGIALDVLLNVETVADEKGRPLRSISTQLDISERKKAERLLEEESRKTQEYLQIADVIILVLDKQGKVTLINRKGCEVLGCRPEEVIGKNWFSNFIPRRELPRVKAVFKSLMDSKTQKAKHVENPVRTKSGKERIISWRNTVLKDEKGRIVGTLSSGEDITEKKRVEERLREDERFLESVFSSIQDGVSILGEDLRILRVNQTMEKWYAHAMPLVGKKCYVAYQGRKSRCKVCPSIQTLKTRKPVSTTVPLIGPKGKVTGWMDLFSFPYFDVETGKMKGVIEYVRNISARKEAEEALKQSEEQYRELADSIAIPFFAFDRNLRYTYWNKASEVLTGIPAERAIGKTLFDLFPESHKTGGPAGIYKSVIKSGKPRSYIQEYSLKGRNYVFDISVYPSKSGISVFARDITERQRAEEELRRSEDKLRSIVEHSSQLFYSHTADHVLTYVSPQTRQFLDCEPEEALVRWTEFATDNPVNAVGFALTEKAIKTGRPQPPYELELVGKKGRKIWVEIRESPVVTDGKTVAIVGAATDVTERKEAEDALRESEERFRREHALLRTLIDHLPDAVYVKDPESRFLVANPAVSRVMGASRPEDLLGRTDFDFYTEEMAKRFREDEKSLMRTKRPLIDKDETRRDPSGRVVNISTTKVPLTDEKGKVVGLVGVSRDFTRIKQTEEELRESREELRKLAAHLQAAREQERTRLARELHDELGQALTALKMDLKWMERRVPIGPAGEKVKSMTELIEETIKETKKIYTDLRPGILDDLGLVPAVLWYAEEFRSRTNIACDLAVQAIHAPLDKEVETALFRIFQEALTNVARHAQASRLKIELREREGWLELKVEDNGQGIAVEDLEKSKSFGLLGIKERVGFMKGQFKIEVRKGGGTSLKVKIPLRKAE